MTPTCSIVIRAYNEAMHLGKLFSGLQQQNLDNFQVILVDSGSSDATVAIARQAGADIVCIEPEEFTFGRSLNLGITAAQSEFIVVASAHIYPVYPDWLERLLAPFSDPQVGLTYGKQRGTVESCFAENQLFAQWYPERSQPRQPHPFCNNANAAIRRSLWEQHPYDETLPGLEDLAWARWAFEQGIRIAYAPEAEIVHIHHESPGGVYNRYRREGMAFKQIYPQESFRLIDFSRLFWVNSVADFREAIRQGVLGKHWRDILWFRWMQFWGTYQGYRQSGPLTWQLKQAFYYPRQAYPQPARPERDVKPIQYSD